MGDSLYADLDDIFVGDTESNKHESDSLFGDNVKTE